MTHTNNNTTRPFQLTSVGKHVLLGAGISLVLIAIFLFGVGEHDPSWGSFWMVRPLIVVPVFGAGGGLFFYLMDYLMGYRGGWKKGLAIIAGLIGYLIALWLGTILGLDGTLWN